MVDANLFRSSTVPDNIWRDALVRIVAAVVI